MQLRVSGAVAGGPGSRRLGLQAHAAWSALFMVRRWGLIPGSAVLAVLAADAFDVEGHIGGTTQDSG